MSAASGTGGRRSVSAESPSRVRSIDLYRGVAVLLMIVAHACDAFLADRFRDGAAWHALDIAFGFVAPAFLFLSGLALSLGMQRHDRIASLSLRHLQILALAYWLQIPVLSLRQLIWNRRPEELARLFDMNILHVVAIAGLLVLGLSRIVGAAPGRLRALVAVLALAAIVATPYAWDSSLGETLWLPLRSIVGPQPAATFPLFPYVAYGMLGFAAAPLVVARDRGAVLPLALSGVALLLGGLALDGPMSALRHHDDFWHGSIQHTIFRLGGVLVALAGSMAIVPLLRSPVTLLERIGRRSLAVYVLHLMLIYGSPMTMGSRYWLDGRLDRAVSPPAVVGLVVGVTLLVCAAALVWPELRRRAPHLTSLLWIAWWVAFAGFFLLTP